MPIKVKVEYRPELNEYYVINKLFSTAFDRNDNDVEARKRIFELLHKEVESIASCAFQVGRDYESKNN